MHPFEDFFPMPRMSEESSLLPEALSTLSVAFVDKSTTLVPGEKVTMDDVRKFLIEKITTLLDRNHGMLMSILYRIDVSERRVKQAMTGSSPAELPAVLADLVIERQLQKLRTKRYYAQSSRPSYP